MRFILKWLVTAIACAVAIWLVPGITPVGSSWGAPLAFALVLALLNATVKPIMQLVSAPITLLTLGLFYLVINAVVLELASYLACNIFHAGIVIDSLGSAIVASIVISLVSMVIGGIVSTDA